jgi:hypothetical protein
MTIDMPPGPPCDVCGELPAVLSLLNFADYQQLKLCGNDAPNVMRGIADSMDGRQTAEPAPELAADPELADDVPTDEAAAAGAAAAAAEDELGSAADHWASTKNVHRSTHGHRTPRGATGKPREDEPR